jgi:hypothetical protein
MDPEKFLPSNWQIAKRVGIDTLPASFATEKIIGEADQQGDTAACFVRMQIASSVTEGVAELAHRVSIACVTLTDRLSELQIAENVFTIFSR